MVTDSDHKRFKKARAEQLRIQAESERDVTEWVAEWVADTAKTIVATHESIVHDVYEVDPVGSGNLLLVSGTRVVNGDYSVVVADGVVLIPISNAKARYVGQIAVAPADITDHNKTLARFVDGV